MTIDTMLAAKPLIHPLTHIPDPIRTDWIELRMRPRAQHTSRLVAEPLADHTLLLEVDVPALALARLVLEREGEDGVALLDGIGALSWVGGQGGLDEVEGLGGGEGSCGSIRR